jgi:hypothetical protein
MSAEDMLSVLYFNDKQNPIAKRHPQKGKFALYYCKRQSSGGCTCSKRALGIN